MTRGAIAIVLLAMQLGSGTPAQRPLEQLERSVRRPLPSLPPAATAPSGARVWVPDRYVDTPAGTYHVPGHWEQRLNDRELYAPPLVACAPSGDCIMVPAGVRPLPERRQAP